MYEKQNLRLVISNSDQNPEYVRDMYASRRECDAPSADSDGPVLLLSAALEVPYVSSAVVSNVRFFAVLPPLFFSGAGGAAAAAFALLSTSSASWLLLNKNDITGQF